MSGRGRRPVAGTRVGAQPAGRGGASRGAGGRTSKPEPVARTAGRTVLGVGLSLSALWFGVWVAGFPGAPGWRGTLGAALVGAAWGAATLVPAVDRKLRLSDSRAESAYAGIAGLAIIAGWFALRPWLGDGAAGYLFTAVGVSGLVTTVGLAVRR